MRREKHMGVRSVEAVRRKLRSLAAMARDAGATEQERATAETLKARLKQRLSEAGVPAGRLDRQRLSSRQVGKGNKEIYTPCGAHGRLDGNRAPAGKSGPPRLQEVVLRVSATTSAMVKLGFRIKLSADYSVKAVLLGAAIRSSGPCRNCS